MGTIKITLETLYDILRNEKKKEDLQRLEETFYEDVVFYLKEKKNLLKNQESKNDIFSAGERDKLEYELRSIRRILKEIYEKREKKIIDIALNKSRTESDIIDTSYMLKEEKQFYDTIVNTLTLYRLGVLKSLFLGEIPNMIDTERRIQFSSSFTPPPPSESPSVEDDTEEPALPPPQVEEKKETTPVRFLHPVPSFVWKDLKVYGPFQIGDTTDLFSEIADLLVRKGRAEKI